MRNLILLTFISLLSTYSFADELSFDQIKSDFRENINHYNYDLNEEQLQPIENIQRERSNESIASNENEILNLESEFSDSATDQVKLRAAAPKRGRTR